MESRLRSGYMYTYMYMVGYIYMYMYNVIGESRVRFGCV